MQLPDEVLIDVEPRAADCGLTVSEFLDEVAIAAAPGPLGSLARHLPAADLVMNVLRDTDGADEEMIRRGSCGTVEERAGLLAALIAFALASRGNGLPPAEQQRVSPMSFRQSADFYGRVLEVARNGVSPEDAQEIPFFRPETERAGRAATIITLGHSPAPRSLRRLGHTLPRPVVPHIEARRA